MKKHHIADVLTLGKVVFTLILAAMTACGTTVDYALWMFAGGELCDALDGICARRWHYPNDGKYRWWRAYAPQIDQATDLALGITCSFYLVLVVRSQISNAAVFIVIATAIIIQAVLSYDQAFYESLPSKAFVDLERAERYRTRLILFRRYIYVIGIATVIIVMIFATSWPEDAKVVLFGTGLMIGVNLAIEKRDRLTQAKTPL